MTTSNKTETEMLTRPQVARKLGVSCRTLWNWKDEGTGPPVLTLPSGQYRYPREGLEEWIADRMTSNEAPQ